MKGKNNKGFTLIEIIAVIVILGIISVFAVPRIYDLVTRSRKNIYVEDAIRLITQAQYTMNSKSMKIDKPDSGECIVFSMKYLSTNDFQNPPNGGTYLSESSFVVVKNINGDYVYSTMIVERTKDEIYMGVELTTEKALAAKDAVKHVRVFNVSEIGYFDDSDWDEGTLIDSSFINSIMTVSDGESLNDWIVEDEDIIEYYNNEKGEDISLEDTATPRISAKFNATGKLNTTLIVTAKDADNNVSDLNICVKVSSDMNAEYPEVNDSTYCEGYGSSGNYEKNINFGDYGFGYEHGSTAYVYILVSDPSNNIARKRLSYEIHENEPPTINSFSITKFGNDKENLPRATIKLSLSDDMTSQEDLQVCFVQDNDSATSCSSYNSYASYFGTVGVYNYTFKNGSADITKPDGSSHSLKVFVKDEKGKVTTEVATYDIYNNKKPTISLGEFTTSCLFGDGNSCTCSTTNCNSLTVTVNMEVDDDLTDPDDLILKLYQLKSDGTTRVGELSMTYSQFFASDRKYTFSGEYNGDNRTLYVDVIDEYGAKETTSQVLRNVYKDLPPTIVRLRDAQDNVIPIITSHEYACTGADSCSNYANGGSYKVDLNFDVQDDTTNSDVIKVCVSEVKADCEQSKINNFINYSSLEKVFEFSTNITDGKIYPTNQITKKLYIAIADGKNQYTAYNNLEPIEYALYHNDSPKISGSFDITSKDENIRPSVDDEGNPIPGYEGGLAGAVIDVSNLDIVDDFDDYQARLCYQIVGGDYVCTALSDFDDFSNSVSEDFYFKDSHGNVLLNEGQQIKAHIDIVDNYNVSVSSREMIYNMYEDKEPEIISSSVKSVSDKYNSYNIIVTFKVNDYDDKYTICVTDNNTCSDRDYMYNYDNVSFDGTIEDEEGYELSIDGHELFNWDENYLNTNPHKELKLFVKDSYGHVKSTPLKNNGSVTYDLYELCSDPNNRVPSDEPPVFDFVSGSEITPSACGGACYKDYKTTDNTAHVNYMTGSNNSIVGNYNKTLTYQDIFVGINCDSYQEEVQLQCDNVRCFNTGDGENPNLISLKLEDEDNKWYYSNSRVTKRTKISKAYCENLDENNYFYPGDRRCVNYENRCYNKAYEACGGAAYDEAMANYEIEKKNDIRDILLLIDDVSGYADPDNYESHVESCMPILFNLRDDDWMNTRRNMCSSEADCNACQSGNPPAGVDCTRYLPADSILCSSFAPLPDTELYFICDALTEADTCNTLYDFLQTQNPSLEEIISEYDAEHRPTNDPSQCIADGKDACVAAYSFCEEPFTTLQKEVSCAADHDIEAYCSRNDYYEGYCLQNYSSCDGHNNEDDPDCTHVCYKTYNCEDEYENKPITFTCNGYFPTYRSNHEPDSNDIILRKTNMRICPEFYRYYFSPMYEFDNNSSTPFIRFNPSEIEIDPRVNGTTGGPDDDGGDNP